jgi:hypothetical protein
LLILFSFVLTLGGGSSPALAGKHHCCETCPQCDNKVCVPTPETTKVKKYCWEIECKDICIPKFKWPWECCCDAPECGQVKTVKVLKKVEYECEECGYKWEIKSVGCGCVGK